jgi:phosphatidylinositol-3-phosphatase
MRNFRPSVVALLACLPIRFAAAADPPPWPSNLPRYDHIVIVVEENKSYNEIIGKPATPPSDVLSCRAGGKSGAPYINKLKADGASLTNMFAEEHQSEGNYFWLFSGDNQKVEFGDQIPRKQFTTSNLGTQLINKQLINKQLSFKSYSEGLPTIGSKQQESADHTYARKHVPWVSFDNLPRGNTVETSSNLRFLDFPSDRSDYSKLLPTVAIVIPNLNDDMHDGTIEAGDDWLCKHLGPYYKWAQTNNSLLIVTFDEDNGDERGPTDPALKQNHIATIFAGAHVKPGYADATPLTHVNILRTIEAMYGLPKSGAQQPLAVRAGISDDTTAADAFQTVK